MHLRKRSKIEMFVLTLLNKMNNVIIETFSALLCEINFERGAVRGPDEIAHKPCSSKENCLTNN